MVNKKFYYYIKPPYTKRVHLLLKYLAKPYSCDKYIYSTQNKQQTLNLFLQYITI